MKESDNLVVNDTKMYMMMKRKDWLNIEIKYDKMRRKASL